MDNKEQLNSQVDIEKELQEIRDKLVELKKYEDDRPYGENDESDKAVKVIKEYLKRVLPYMRENKIVPVYWGSIQYHDPHNLDVDLDFFAESEDIEHSKDFKKKKEWIEFVKVYMKLHDIDKEDSDWRGFRNWPRKSGYGHPSFTALQQIQKEIEGVVENDYPVYDLNIAIILSGVCLYEEQRELLEHYREWAWKILNENKSNLRIKVLSVLDSAIKVRKERREEIKNKEQDPNSTS